MKKQDKNYQNKGYGRAVMSAAVEGILKENSIPYFDAGAKNKPAIHIAETLGFKIYQGVSWT